MYQREVHMGNTSFNLEFSLVFLGISDEEYENPWELLIFAGLRVNTENRMYRYLLSPVQEKTTTDFDAQKSLEI